MIYFHTPTPFTPSNSKAILSMLAGNKDLHDKYVIVHVRNKDTESLKDKFTDLGVEYTRYYPEIYFVNTTFYIVHSEDSMAIMRLALT